MQRGEPRNARAYELYLRANLLAQNRQWWAEARDLYLQCVDEDPAYAPAWARLGRVHRVLAKYGQTEDVGRDLRLAREAFERALALDPDSSLAHNLFTYFEIEERGGAADAMVRLLARAQSHPSEAEIFSGLVVACRFCGILDGSVAADRRGRQSDPHLSSSLAYPYWLMGSYEEAIRHAVEDMRFTRLNALPMVGRTEEAIREYREIENSSMLGLARVIVIAMRAALEGRQEEAIQGARTLLNSSFRDPEGLYFLARLFAYVGEPSLALDVLADVVARGFWCAPAINSDPWLDSVRDDDRFIAIADTADSHSRSARARFRDAGGPQLLGVHALAR
jgi:tetratricopeptide (TPR) repeat protein